MSLDSVQLLILAKEKGKFFTISEMLGKGTNFAIVEILNLNFAIVESLHLKEA